MGNEHSTDVYKAEIMIIDGTMENITSLKDIFMSEGYVLSSSNSRELNLLFIEKKQPDIIILDINMHSPDGFEICKRLKSEERMKDIPIIFINALDDMEDDNKACILGTTDFITKPFNRQEVIVRIRNHLNFRMRKMQSEKEISDFQIEKEKRAEELIIANKELAFQNEEKEKRASELIIADKELAFQNEEKEKRAEELIIADKESAFQNEEKEKRAEELIIANKELAFQNEEKEKRAEELIIADKELAFQNKEKKKRAKELVIADKELAFQNEEKEKRAEELIIADKELAFQNKEKKKRAKELIIANKELAFQSEEIEQMTKELLLAKEEILLAGIIISKAWKYNRSLIYASTYPIMTIVQDGTIIEANTAVEVATGLPRDKIIGTNFSQIFTDPEKAKSYYQTVFEKGKSFHYELNIKHIAGFTTPVIYNAFLFSDDEEKEIGLLVGNDDITTINNQNNDIIYLQIDLNLLIKQRTSELITANEKLAIENEKNEYLGYHDHLTGLYNRRFFEKELIRLDTRTNLPLSIIMCDINGLKLINDSFGHGYGDELLIKAAETIKKACREGDIVSRLGGDEFGIILPNTDTQETVHIANIIKKIALNGKVEMIELSISYGYETKKSDEQLITETFATAENHMYRHKLYERSSMRSKPIDLIMKTLFEKSNRESLHSDRVSHICQAIATELNFDPVNVDKMRIAGLVHDIGKIGIDERILNKAGSLNDAERIEIRRHPEIGWRILSTTPEFLQMARFVLNHHERWDGEGYPNGIKGEAIPLESRIIVVADAYDAMTSVRSYRRGMDKEEAIIELKRGSGTQFDPGILDVFMNRILPYSAIS